MPTKDLSNQEVLQLLTLYKTALEQAIGQTNNTEDIALLNHMVSNVSSIKNMMEVELPSNKFSWKIMTFISGVPQVLNSTRACQLQYDTEQNINQNIQTLYYNLLRNNTVATENLKNHVNRNNNLEIISVLLMLISLILAELIAPWSAWGVSFLIPLYSTLVLPVIVILFLSIGLEITSRLHNLDLKQLYFQHNHFEKCKRGIDSDGISNQDKTVRFFQPSNSNDLLSKVETSYDYSAFAL